MTEPRSPTSNATEPRRWHLLLSRHHSLWASRKTGPHDERVPSGQEFHQYNPTPVREDLVTDADVEAIGKAIHDYACGCDRPWPTNANYEEMARAAAEAILGRS